MLTIICLGYSDLLTDEVSAVENSPSTVIQYYIKNVKSGKYLTVQGANFSAGTKIVQWHYTGDDNQKWKFEEAASPYSGYYRIVSANHTSLAIQFADGLTGTLAKLAAKTSTGISQLYTLSFLDNASYRFKSNISNFLSAVVVNNAGIYDNTSIVQGDMGVQWSDQWLLEPVVDYNGGWATIYAQANRSHHLATYPDFDFYNDTNDNFYQTYGSDPYESTNYVSQCLAFGGKHYVSNDWYCNKVSHMQNQTLTQANISTWWNLSNNWYKPTSFYYKWKGSYSDCYFYIDTPIEEGYLYTNPELKQGDVVQIIRFVDSDFKVLLSTFVKYAHRYTNSGNNCTYAYVECHTDGNNYSSSVRLSDLCDEYKTYYNANYIRIIHID